MEEIRDLAKTYKDTFLFTFLSVLAAHMAIFTNYWPNWDSLGSMKMGPWVMFGYGRWLGATMARLLTSPFDLQWVSGLEAALFLAFTLVLLIDLFQIRLTLSRGLAVVSFVVFPSVASTITYSIWYASYFASLSLAVLAVWLCVRREGRRSAAVAMLCVVLSLGIYQIYFLTATTAFLYFLAVRLLDGETRPRSLLPLLRRWGIVFGGGMAVYGAVTLGLLAVTHRTLSSYQGISSVGRISPAVLAQGLYHIVWHSAFFHLGSLHLNLYMVLNISVWCLAAAILWRGVLSTRTRSPRRRAFLILLFLSAVPVTYAYEMISPGVQYHRIMEIGHWFLYLAPLIVLEREDIPVFLRRAFPCALALLCFYHLLNDNVAYKQLEMGYESARFEVAEVLQKIDQVNNEDLEEVALFGAFDTSDEGRIQAVPYITGASVAIVTSPPRFLYFVRYYFDRSYVLCPEERAEAIARTEEYAEMPCYPHGDYVRIIDGVIVVKLPEEG